MESNPSPDTVKNKLSAVRKYITLSNGDLTGINSIWVKNAVDAINRIKYYDSNIKKPISTKNFKKIVLSQPNTHTGNCIRAMLLLLYFGAFRQSEIAPATKNSFKKSKNMCRKDISFKKGAMYIDLRWAKNQQRWDQKRHLKIPPIEDKRLCPVLAIKKVFSVTQSRKRNDPVFTFKDGTPVSVNFLRRKWVEDLKILGLSAKDYSLHSIRKSAASNAYRGGCRPLEIQRFAGWSSEAHLKYIKTSAQKSVNKVLSSAIQV